MEERIKKAIARLEKLQDKYDECHEITSIDLAHVIEILKGRE